MLYSSLFLKDLHDERALFHRRNSEVKADQAKSDAELEQIHFQIQLVLAGLGIISALVIGLAIKYYIFV